MASRPAPSRAGRCRWRGPRPRGGGARRTRRTDSGPRACRGRPRRRRRTRSAKLAAPADRGEQVVDRSTRRRRSWRRAAARARPAGCAGSASPRCPPTSMPSATTAVCRRSPRYFGTSLPTRRRADLVAGAADPLEPARDRVRAPPPGHQVHGAHVDPELEGRRRHDRLSRPALSASSTSIRCSRAIDPWWERRGPPRRARSAGRPAARRSAACSRTRWWSGARGSARAARGGSRARWRCGPAGRGGARSAGTSTGFPMLGHVLDRDDDLEVERACGRPASTICDRPAARRGASNPPRNRAISSSGRCVAESPIRWAAPRRCASSRSSESIRCAPRFVAAIAWISSTITVVTLRSVSRPDDVSIR